jgi:WD40 repeat protein/enamine deaminase RidA (YjgF/YER057c/UK114 family)
MTCPRRYGSALELADDLRHFLDGRPIQGRPVSIFERGLKWARRKPALASLLAVSASAVLVLLALWFAFTTELRAERNHALEQTEEAQRQAVLAQENAREASRQGQRAEQEANRARASEDEARQETERGRSSLFTAQVWRAAGLWEKDPALAAALLDDPGACPPDLRDFSWRLYRRLVDIERPSFLAGDSRGRESNEVFALDVARVGRRAATGGADGSVRLWNLDTGKETAVLHGHTGAVRCIAFSKDGRRLLSGGDDGTVRLWNVAPARPLRVLGRHSGPVTAVAFGPDGTSVVSGSGKRRADNPVRDTSGIRPELVLWDVSTGKGKNLYADQPPMQRVVVTALAFSPDGKLLASGHPIQVFARLWETETGKLLGELPRRNRGVIHAVAFAPGGKILATAGGDYTVKLWNVDTRQEIAGRSPLRGHVGEVYDVCFSGDGRFLVSASADRTCKLWDPLTGEERTTLRAGGPVRRVALGPAGKRVFLAAADRVHQFILPSYPEQAPLTGHAAQVAGLVPSADGQRVAATLRNQTVAWWDVHTARALGSWQPRDFFLAAVAWSPDGTVLAAAGATLDPDAKPGESEKHSGHDLRFFHLGRRTGHLGWRGKGPTITAIAFHPDRAHFATGSEDGTVRVWRLTWRQGIPHLSETPLWSVGPEGGQGAVLAVGFIDDGTTVFAARSSGLRIWQTESGKERDALPRSVTAVALARDRRTLALAGADRRVSLLDLTEFRGTDVIWFKATFGPLPLEISCLAVSDDLRTLAAGQGPVVGLWDVRTRQQRAALARHTQTVTALTFAAGDTVLASGSGDQTEAWFVRAGELLLWSAPPVATHGGSIRHIDPDNASVSSKAVVVGPACLAHTAQLLPFNRRGQLVGVNKPDEQAEQVLDNLETTLGAIRSGLDALVKLNLYVADDKAAEALAQAMARRFPKSARPALSFVTTRLPHKDALLALDAVAVTPVKPEAKDLLRTVPGLSCPAGCAPIALLPDGARIYVAGQAEPGDLATATRKTLEGLDKTLTHLRLTTASVVQVKAFLQPMSNVAAVEKEVKAFFGIVPPLVLVEWKSSEKMPIEIELIAHAGPSQFSAPDVVDYLTPPGMTASPLFSRVARVHYGPSIYVSGLYADKVTGTKDETERVFAALKEILEKAGSDLKHLVKATYYVSSEEASKALNDVRPKFYDPKRPPAASKALVAGVARSGRALTMDLIAVPTLRVPESPPENGHGLTEKDAAAGGLSLFDGSTPFGWKGASVENNLLCGPGTTTAEFGNVAVRAEVVRGGTITVGGKEVKVEPGHFRLAETGAGGPIGLGSGVAVSKLLIQPLGLKAIYNGKDLTGWKRIDRASRPVSRRPVWKVEGGKLVATGGPGALEYEKEQFGDLVLQVDVRTRRQHANSGVFFRGIPGDFMNGYEAQVYNRCLDGDPSRPAIWCSGGIDNRQNARRMVSRDFKTFRMTVLAHGPHLATWVNGYQVTDWTDTRARDANPRKGLRTDAGAIQLQAHDPDTDVEFGAILVSELKGAKKNK